MLAEKLLALFPAGDVLIGGVLECHSIISVSGTIAQMEEGLDEAAWSLCEMKGANWYRMSRHLCPPMMLKKGESKCLEDLNHFDIGARTGAQIGDAAFRRRNVCVNKLVGVRIFLVEVPLRGHHFLLDFNEKRV
jgi:hypothetical protein